MAGKDGAGAPGDPAEGRRRGRRAGGKAVERRGWDGGEEDGRLKTIAATGGILRSMEVLQGAAEEGFLRRTPARRPITITLEARPWVREGGDEDVHLLFGGVGVGGARCGSASSCTSGGPGGRGRCRRGRLRGASSSAAVVWLAEG